MERSEFVHSSSRIRTLESKLLSKDDIEELVQARDLRATVDLLESSNYSQGFSNIEQAEDYDEAIYFELERLYTEVRDISPYEEIVDLVALKYQAHNMRVIFKDFVMGTDHKALLYPESLVGEEESIGNKSYEDEILKSLDEIDIDFSSSRDGQIDPLAIDLGLDEWFYQELIAIAQSTGVDYFERYANDYIDFSNIISLLRIKNQGRAKDFASKVIRQDGYIASKEIIGMFDESLEDIVGAFKNSNIGKRLTRAYESFEESQSISSFEIEFDNYQMDIAKEAKYISFGPEVILAYLISREIEIKNIRLILVSKLNRLSPEFIRERLRDTYA